MIHYVLDEYYLAITLLVTVGWQLLGFALAYGLQVDKFTDLWGAINFAGLGSSLMLLPIPPRPRLSRSPFSSAAVLTLTLGGTYSTRSIVASVFVIIWAAR